MVRQMRENRIRRDMNEVSLTLIQSGVYKEKFLSELTITNRKIANIEHNGLW